MSWIIARLTSKIAGPIAAAIALILAITLAVVITSKNATIREVRGQLATAAKDRDDARRDRDQCRANTATLELTISRQNAAVEAMAAESERRIAELDKAAAKAKADGLAAVSRATEILNRKGSTCEDADALIAWSLFK